MTITTLVDHAITFAIREFVYAPIRSERFTSVSMKNSTMITFISGRRGTRTNPAPTTISSVYQ